MEMAVKSETLNDSFGSIIENAYRDNRLAIAEIEQFYSDRGVALPDKANPVVAHYFKPIGGRTYLCPKTKGALSLQAIDDLKVAVPLPQFEGGEHGLIGDQVVLRFCAGSSARNTSEVPFQLPNGLTLTYGQVLTLGGKFYANPEYPISEGKSAADREQRFINAYNLLALKEEAKDEAANILDIIDTEIKVINEAVKNGEQVSDVYRKLGEFLHTEWNRITGGGGPASPWLPSGRYLKLATSATDYFSHDALLAYQAGHGLAIKEALAARDLNNREEQRVTLQRAYAINAFADHYLVYLFCAGRLRCPSKQLRGQLTPPSTAQLLARYMYDEDCANGLYVENKGGHHWKVYGDLGYFDMVDFKNIILVNGAVQLSADEIFQAYLCGSAPTVGQYAAMQIIPNIKAVQKSQPFGSNLSPLFLASGNKLQQRNDPNNPLDFSWTDRWHGPSTLFWLNAHYKGPSWQIGSMTPPTQAPTINPDGWQTDTPIPSNWIKGNKVRYCATFVDGLDETEPGPWSEWVMLTDRFLPMITGIPTDPTHSAKARNLYRQFIGKPFSHVGTITDNCTTFFIDRTQ